MKRLEINQVSTLGSQVEALNGLDEHSRESDGHTGCALPEYRALLMDSVKRKLLQ